MTILYPIEVDFFVGHLNGARIPVFLHMLRALQEVSDVQVLQGGHRSRLQLDLDAPTMDAAYASASLEPASDDPRFALAIFQKGQPRDAIRGLDVVQTALMLNDPRARQAANQWHELLSCRFGFDRYRLSAPWRYLQGLRQDRTDLRQFDKVFVQSEIEARFLRDCAGRGAAQVEIFSNAAVTLKLFPEIAVPSVGADRARRFLLPVPPGTRREAEYRWFLKKLSAYPELAAQTTVLARENFLKDVPPGFDRRPPVEDYQKYLVDFACVLVPTKHYTGLNNRVFQAACSGCRVIASPEALCGLMSGHPALTHAPRSFTQMRDAMLSFPEGSTAAEDILAACSR